VIKYTQNMLGNKYKNQGRVGLFDKEESVSKLSKLGNPLEKLHKVIDFEMFRSELEEICSITTKRAMPVASLMM